MPDASGFTHVPTIMIAEWLGEEPTTSDTLGCARVPE
jgi:hypothetical protein